jgi:hypothetical protein
MPKADDKINDAVIENMLSWRHFGFNIHRGPTTWPNTGKGFEDLAHHIIRACFFTGAHGLYHYPLMQPGIPPFFYKIVSAPYSVVLLYDYYDHYLNFARVGGLQSQGAKGEAVVGYREPLATRNLKSSGTPEG